MKGIRLDEAVAAQAGVTRSRARSLILAGRIRVDGRTLTKPGTCIPLSAQLDMERPRPYVGRGGEKLEGALRAFELDVRGARALDVGASTGGFTHCLLEHGAAQVTALDVGYGQLDYMLREHPQVSVMERCNFRLLPDDAFAPSSFNIVTIDVSFISVLTIIARARAFLQEDGAIVALIKPQFEAGPARLGKGGVVREPEVHRAILHESCAAITALGLVVRKLMLSPLRGASGNAEFFALVAAQGAALPEGELEGVLAQAHSV